MASVNIKYSCGCGFSTHKLEEAAEHADTTGHTLTVLGAVSRPKSREPDQPSSLDRMSELRKRLQAAEE